MRLSIVLVSVCVLIGCGTATVPRAAAALAPKASWHQHLLSPDIAPLMSESAQPFGADQLIVQLDAAGIQHALVLSLAYIYGDPRRQIDDELAKVRAENDWTGAQVARYPDRLIGFCGLSPLKSYALDELERCARHPHLFGLKLHFGNSGVDLQSSRHVELIRRVFHAANERRLPIVVHLRTRERTYGENRAYGPRDAEVFLSQILPAAPDIPVQIAHLAGAGPGYPPSIDAAMAIFANAVAAKDPRVRNVYFDVTTVVTTDTTPENAALIVARIRQVGVRRVLFGADLSLGGNPPPAEAWAAFRSRLRLTEKEFKTIASNSPPYSRR
jgi:predicted TIM-barrel fold metal-dependent hydrolase